ncbi:Endonuclease III [Balamuthia mandrillaris]
MQRRTTTRRQRRSSDAAQVLIRYEEEAEEEEEEVVVEEEEEEEGVSDGSDFEWGHENRKRATTTAPRRRKSWPQQKRPKRSSSNSRKTKVKKGAAEKGEEEEEEGTAVDETLLRWDGLEGAAAAEAHRGVHAVLVGLYGRPEPRQDPEGGSRSSANCCGRKETVLEALISIVLSQNTSDRNSRAAYRGLKTRFPSPAGNEEVKEEAKGKTSDATANANQAKKKRLLPVKKEKKEDGESENYTETKIKEEEEEEDDKRKVKVKQEASTTIDMEAVRLSKVEDIEDAIRPGGLAKTKARRIKALLQQIHEERGGSTSLEFLRDMPTEALKEYLRKFDGVGPKTISCLLLFTLCRDDMPVDTHVARVSRRLGWVKHNSSREGTYEHLNRHMPDELKYDLHNLLIAHGRKLCRSSNPICEQCPLRQQHCLYYKHAIEGKNDNSSRKKSQMIRLDENYFRSALAQIEEKLEDEELKRNKTTTVKKERIKREKKDA